MRISRHRQVFFPKVTQVLILEAMSEPQVSLRGKKKKSRFFLAIAEHQSQILVWKFGMKEAV